MKRLFPIALLTPLFFAGPTFAQSLDIDAAQEALTDAITGTFAQSLDIDAAREALTDAITGALVDEAAGIIETLPDTLNPDILNPDVRGEDPEVALSELITALMEAVVGALQQQGRVILDSDFNEIP